MTVETVGETTEAAAPGVLRPAQAVRRRVRHGAQPQRAAGDRDGVGRTLGAPTAAPRVVELDPVLPRRTQRGALELVDEVGRPPRLGHAATREDPSLSMAGRDRAVHGGGAGHDREPSLATTQPLGRDRAPLQADAPLELDRPAGRPGSQGDADDRPRGAARRHGGAGLTDGRQDRDPEPRVVVVAWPGGLRSGSGARGEDSGQEPRHEGGDEGEDEGPDDGGRRRQGRLTPRWGRHGGTCLPGRARGDARAGGQGGGGLVPRRGTAWASETARAGRSPTRSVGNTTVSKDMAPGPRNR